MRAETVVLCLKIQNKKKTKISLIQLKIIHSIYEKKYLHNSIVNVF